MIDRFLNLAFNGLAGKPITAAECRDGSILLLVAERYSDRARETFWGYMDPMPLDWRLEWKPIYRLRVRLKTKQSNRQLPRDWPKSWPNQSNEVFA